MGFANLFETLSSFGHVMLTEWERIGSNFNTSLYSFLVYELGWTWVAFLRDFLELPATIMSTILGFTPEIKNIIETVLNMQYTIFFDTSLLYLTCFTPLLAILIKLISKLWDLIPLI